MLIKTIVENLMKKYKTNCPFALAKALNINIVYENLGSTMGYYTNDFRIKFIHINQQLNEKDCTYTCSHELGHAIQHPNTNTPFLKRHTLFSVDKIEREANTFAVELLLPDKLLRENPDCSVFNIARSVGIPAKLIKLKLK
jgi:Zn-dependent peptidase ImmA (M78 family)